jgi:hypothetical protein
VLTFEEKIRKHDDLAYAEVSKFFMNSGDVRATLQKIARRLEAIDVPYAVAGGMALFEHGHERLTVDVDILVTPEGLKTLHEKLEGLGYDPPFARSKHLRDTKTGVKVKFLTTGSFAGDGKPKPVGFPDPETCSVEIRGLRFVNLETLFEMKLASGMTNTARMKDLADAIALIEARKLGADFALKLHPYVREKYLELWRAVQDNPTLDE